MLDAWFPRQAFLSLLFSRGLWQVILAPRPLILLPASSAPCVVAASCQRGILLTVRGRTSRPMSSFHCLKSWRYISKD